jgi:hypothetical protein
VSGAEHCTALHGTALHCTALHCTALQANVSGAERARMEAVYELARQQTEEIT